MRVALIDDLFTDTAGHCVCLFTSSYALENGGAQNGVLVPQDQYTQLYSVDIVFVHDDD